MIVEELRKEFKSEGHFQLALFSYVYNDTYKEDLARLKESLTDSEGEDND